MPLPLAPIAGIAVRYGVVALATYVMVRKVERAHVDQRGQDAMDDVSEGLSVRKEPEQVHGAGRFCRTVRIGANGPGLEIDLTALGRVKFRKV